MTRRSKPITRRRLEAAARHHLERWSASRAHLERLLRRRVTRALAIHGGDPDEIDGWIREILDALAAAGVLDDARLARDKARRLHERGTSTRAIRARLADKGLPAESIGAAVAELEHEERDPDVRAAAAYVRKRRMGPFRSDPSEWRERDLARLARAGFPMRAALRVLDARDAREVEGIELGLAEEPDDR